MYNMLGEDTKGVTRVLPHYSTDIAAAWQVVEKMQADGWVLDLQGEKNSWYCMFLRAGFQRAIANGRHRSAPLAICLSALKTVENT